jgi:diguanylate cyclase (GGDEF)-like protein
MNQRRHVWLGVALLVLVAGSLGSIWVARDVAQNDAHVSRESLVGSSNDIASTLNLTIQHEEDLSIAAGVFFIANADSSQTAFRQWTNTIQAFERYPELEGIAEIVRVPASQLSAFAAREIADPSGPLGPGGTYQVLPSGIRPYYCLEAVSQSRTTQLIPAGTDYCNTVIGPGLLRARDTGQGAYEPFNLGHSTVLGVGIPLYRGGAVPATVQARREAFIGWVGIDIRPSVLLTAALSGHPGAAVMFRYQGGSSRVSVHAGTAPVGAQSDTVDLHNGWYVEVFGKVTGAGLFSNGNALARLLDGIGLSLLLAALIYLLGTGRSRAMQLVQDRTDQLRYQALHDSLTGLPNRTLILDRIDQMLARARRSHVAVAALFIDLDDFKDINDTLGHTAGDQLLAGIGSRLARALREEDTVGRLGGDEFVVLVEGASLAAGAEVVAQRILDVLETPFEIAASEVPLSVTASIGVAGGDRVTPEELLRDADIALYRAKAAGKRRAVVFSPSMQLVVNDQRNLAVDLHRALDLGQFFLLYQPIVELSSAAFTGVEALLRWRHPERGVVQPDDFVPALESSGLIVPVGQWVLEEACRQGATWHEQGHRISISVNISVRQLERDRIVDDLHGALAWSGFDPSKLILELTETTLMSDVAGSVARLNLLKALGVRLAIDDFGTGYSSLAYLRQFPIDVLKIDRSFVSGPSDTPEAAALIHTLVQLGKVLGLETIAEGIETNDQRMRLRAEGVDGGQGFLFAEPLDVVAVDRLLTAGAVHAEVRASTRDAQ